MESFGTRLRQLRQERQEIQGDVAKLLGVSISTYASYEGVREPSYERLKVLAQHYNVTTDYLLGLSKHRQPENSIAFKTLGLGDKSLELLKKMKGRTIQIEGTEEITGVASYYTWDMILDELISTAEFSGFIALLGRRVHPSIESYDNVKIQAGSMTAEISRAEFLDDFLYEFLRTLIARMQLNMRTAQ